MACDRATEKSEEIRKSWKKWTLGFRVPNSGNEVTKAEMTLPKGSRVNSGRARESWPLYEQD